MNLDLTTYASGLVLDKLISWMKETKQTNKKKPKTKQKRKRSDWSQLKQVMLR